MRELRVFSKNAAYQKLEVLKSNRNKRYKYGEFLVEGVRNINQARKNGWSFSSLIYSDSVPLSDWAKEVIAGTEAEQNIILSEELMKEMSGKEDTSELLAVIKMRDDSPESLKLSEIPLLVLFDRPSNRGNLGTLIRSCDALGVDALILTGHAVDLYDPEVVSAGMGSFFNLPVIRMHDNDEIISFVGEMKEKYPGFKTIATTAHKKTAIYQEDLRSPEMLMIGNETMGLCKAFYDIADLLVSIPMAESSSASSFNVSCAATAMIYEITRQRNS